MANIKDIHGNLLSLSASDILIPSLNVSLADAIAQRLLPVPYNVMEQVEWLESKVAHAVGTISSVTVDIATDETGTTHAEGAYQDGVLAIKLYNVKGDKGDALTFEDLTDEQKAELRGEKLTFADLTEDEKNELRGAEGESGKSAYDLAVENGFVGTMAEWLESLKGEKGEPGTNGEDGKSGADGHLDNVVQTVNPSDTANAPSGKAVADYVAAHSGQGGGDSIVAGDNVTIETLPNGSKRINAQLAAGTAQAASEVSYNNGDGTQTNLQNKVREIDNRLAVETTTGSEEEMAWTDEENGETYAKVNKNGFFSKAFFYMDGSPVGGGRNITNKNILAIGDSITDYATWTTALISKFGCHVYNRGVHGSTFGDYLKPNGEEDDVPSIIDRLEMAAYNGATHDLGFPDAANVDIVCVMAGINDWGKGIANHVNVAFGELNTTSDVRTFCGGVKTALFSIAERYYNKKLFLILPTHVLSNTFSYWNEIAENNGAITILKDKENKTYNDYRAVIRYYGLLYGYHILDSFESGLNALIPINNQTYYQDGLHPNAEGGSILAEFIGNNLINNI